jgi:hypothetical protein
MLSINHNAMYLIACPTGSHSKTQKYTVETKSRNGIRNRKSPIEGSVQTMLDGAGGTGKKGAIAVPNFVVSYLKLMQKSYISCDVYVPLSRNWLYFSIAADV